jgi:hypothetical protein
MLWLDIFHSLSSSKDTGFNPCIQNQSRIRGAAGILPTDYNTFISLDFMAVKIYSVILWDMANVHGVTSQQLAT